MWDLNILPTSSAFPSEKAAEHHPKTIDNNKIDDDNNTSNDIQTELTSKIIDSSSNDDLSDEIIIKKKKILNNIDLSMTSTFVLPAKIANRDVHINGLDDVILNKQKNLIEKSFPLLASLPKFKQKLNNITNNDSSKLLLYLQKEQNLQQKIISDLNFCSSSTSPIMQPVTSDDLYQTVVKLANYKQILNNTANNTSTNLRNSIKRNSSTISNLSVIKATKKNIKRTSLINKKINTISVSPPLFLLSSQSSESSSSESSFISDSNFSKIVSMENSTNLNEENNVLNTDNNKECLNEVNQQKNLLNYDNNFDKINNVNDTSIFYNMEDGDSLDDDEFEIFKNTDKNNIVYDENDSMELSDKDEFWNLQEGNIINKISNVIFNKQKKHKSLNYYLNNKTKNEEQDILQFPPQKHPRRDFSNFNMFKQDDVCNLQNTLSNTESNTLKKRRSPSYRFLAKKKKIPSNFDSNIILQSALKNLSNPILNSAYLIENNFFDSNKSNNSNFVFSTVNSLCKNKNVLNQQTSNINIKLLIDNQKSSIFTFK